MRKFAWRQFFSAKEKQGNHAIKIVVNIVVPNRSQNKRQDNIIIIVLIYGILCNVTLSRFPIITSIMTTVALYFAWNSGWTDIYAFFLRSVLEKDKKLSGINDKNTHYLSFISDKMITFTPDQMLLSWLKTSKYSRTPVGRKYEAKPSYIFILLLWFIVQRY